MKLQSQTPTFSFSGFGNFIKPNMPVGDLSARVTGIGSWFPLSANGQTLTSGSAQVGNDPPADVSISYQFSSNPEERPVW